jgi:hypothetical protein
MVGIRTPREIPSDRLLGAESARDEMHFAGERFLAYSADEGRHPSGNLIHN